MAVLWSNAARHDLFRIFDFNAGYDCARAELIDRRLVDEADRLARRPLAGRPIDRTAIREWSVPDIQYVIRYRVGEHEITIIAVRHTREQT